MRGSNMRGLVGILAMFVVIGLAQTAHAQEAKTQDKSTDTQAQPQQGTAPAAQPAATPTVPGTPAPTQPAATTDGTATQAPATPAATQPAQPTVPAPVVKGRKQVPGTPQESSSTELKLRQLAALVEDLKNRVTSLRYKLELMKEVVMEEKSAIGGAKLVVQHINDMGGSFKMIRLRYFLNGRLLQSYNAANSKDESTLSKHIINIPVGLVSPGNMKLKVFITYQGNGYGIFRYVRKWTWEVSGEYKFTVEAGKAYTLKVIGYEKGNFNTPLKDRPAIKFKVRVQPLMMNKKGSSKKSGSKKGSK